MCVCVCAFCVCVKPGLLRQRLGPAPGGAGPGDSQGGGYAGLVGGWVVAEMEVLLYISLVFQSLYPPVRSLSHKSPCRTLVTAVKPSDKEGL